MDKCERQESNLHPLRDQILSLARLPISPLSRVSQVSAPFAGQSRPAGDGRLVGIVPLATPEDESMAGLARGPLAIGVMRAIVLRLANQRRSLGQELIPFGPRIEIWSHLPCEP
jgi:hypothetical protein